MSEFGSREPRNAARRDPDGAGQRQDRCETCSAQGQGPAVSSDYARVRHAPQGSSWWNGSTAAYPKRGPAAEQGPPLSSAVARFVLLSGMGWLLDLGVYMASIRVGASIFAAALLGATCGASLAFLTASRFVFQAPHQRLAFKLTLYLGYTACLIVCAATLIDATADLLFQFARPGSGLADFGIFAFAAKCLVTPLTLALNYLVSRFLLNAVFQRVHE